MVKQAGPATAAAVNDKVDLSDEVRAAASKRNRRLATIVVSVAGVVLAAFVASVAGIARAHAVDRDLYQHWNSATAEYDCCYPRPSGSPVPDRPEVSCAEGKAALFTLRERLQARERESHVVADLLARMLGLADIEVTTGPGLGQVEAEFAQCLQGWR
jgi:hypothetical protein